MMLVVVLIVQLMRMLLQLLVESELIEKTIYMKKGTPCINCNAKYGEQCQKEVIYNSKCLSSSVRTEA